MFRKTLSVPFWLIAGVVKLIGKIIGAILSLGFGTFRLVASRLFGVFFGALIGFILGQKHIKVKLFTGKKR